MVPKYKTSVPITEEELKDLTIVKANLEQILQKPLTIRATFSLILRYMKEKVNSEEFKKEILSISKAENKEIPKAETITTREENVQGETEQMETVGKEDKEIKKEREEKGGFLSSIFKRK
jgi:hypothetical protein